MARRGTYLIQRKGSRNWNVRFQYSPALRATARMVMDSRIIRSEWSLGTPDRREAEILAAPLIANYRRLLLIHAARSEAPQSVAFEVAHRLMEPGLHRDQPELGYITHVTEREIIVYGPDNSIRSKRPNTVIRDDVQLDPTNLSPPLKRQAAELMPKIRTVDVDAEIVEEYIRDRGKDKEDAKLARDTLAAFKQSTGGKLLSVSVKSDVVDFIKHQSEKGGRRGTGLKLGTIKRAIAMLKAAVNLELKADKPRLVRNVFATVTIDADETAEKRVSYTRDDVEKINKNLHVFDSEERLMLIWHLSSGIRPGGIYSITHDEWEEAEDEDSGEVHYTRHVRITKDKSRKYGPRNLPIPDAVLNLTHPDGSRALPDRITGPMFRRKLDVMLATIGNKLAAMEVNTGGKTLYSGRHRAVDRMRARVDFTFRKAILGHSRAEIEDRYGHGHAQWRLKREMEKIGV